MATTLQHQLPSDADISQFIEDNKSHSQMSGHYSTSGPRLGMNFEVDKKWQQKQRELNSEHQKDNREYLQKRQLRNKELQRQRYSLHKHSPVRYDKNQNDYKQVKRELAEERRRDYEQFIIMKKKLEDNTYGISPRGEIDYIQRHQAFADEKRRDYNIWLQQRQQEQRYRWYREVTPPGGLPVGEYEQRRKVLQETRKRDYRDMLKKQKKSQLLIQAQQNGDIPVIDRRYPQKDVTNYSYPVPKFDFRDGQPILGNNPRQFASLPPGPENPLMYMPPEAGREFAAPPVMSEPQGQDHGLGQFAGPAPPLVDSREQQLPPLEQEYPTLLHASREEETFRAFTNSEERNMERKKHIGDERKHEYQQFLEKKERDEQKKREQFQLSYVPPAQAKKNDWYSAEEYEKRKYRLKDERHREYNEFMLKQRSQPKQRMGKTPNVEDNQLLFLGQYERTRRELAELRKKECIEYTEQSPRPKTRKPLPIDGHGMVLPLGTYESTRKNLQEERKKDFKVFIEQARQRASEPPRHEPQDKEDSQQGFVGNLGAYEKERHMINEERQRDYNKFLDQKYISNSKPKGRPDFVKTKEIQNKLDTRLEGHHYYRTTGGPPGPSQSPLQAKSPIGQTYAELLEQKRRQEARYRQNDPVYHRSDEMRVMRQSPASFQRTEALY